MVAGLLLGVAAAPAAALASARPPLRLGVLDGSPPCSDQSRPGHWQGLAVDLWREVAGREGLAYVMQPFTTASALLEASRNDAIDMGVGCLTLSAERLGRYRFSLPFQESGLALLMRRNRLAAGASLGRALLNPQLLRVLALYLAAIALLSWLVWHWEHRNRSATDQTGTGATGEASGPARRREALRSYALVFQVLATGPGTNVIVNRTRGHGLILLSWLVRIIGASMIVSTITLDVLQQQPAAGVLPRSLDDLAGLRVAARPGSVSEHRLQEPPLRGRVQLVPLTTLNQATTLLLERRADAVLADEQQLEHARNSAPAWQRGRLQLVLQGRHPESQGFVYSSRLDPALALRLDQAISTVKRQGSEASPPSAGRH